MGGDEIVSVSVADGSRRVLISLSGRNADYYMKISASPDGRHMAFELGSKEDPRARNICLLAIDESGEGALLELEHPADDSSPFWTPDGKGIVFTSDRSGSQALWMLAVEEGKPKGAATPLADIRSFSRPPMGLTSAGSYYYSFGTRNSNIDVVSFDFNAGKVLSSPDQMPLPFTGSNFAPSWSPDGKHIAYLSARRKLRNLDGLIFVIRSLETGEEREHSFKSLSGISGTKWSPDGRSILVRGKLKRVMGFHLVDVQTGDLTTIMEGVRRREGGPRNPVFSKDGKEIYYIRWNQSAIFAYDLETHIEKELYRSKTSIPQISVVSPDGQRLAFIETETVKVGRPAMIKTLSISGGEPRDVYPLGKESGAIRGMVWTPQGDVVAIENSSDFADTVFIIPAEGGDARELELEFEVPGRFSLHPDGQRIVYSRGRLNGELEIWALENFLPKSTGGE